MDYRVPTFDLAGQFREGQQRGQNRAALRDFFAPAVGGDQNALAKLMQVNPQAAQQAQSLGTSQRKSSQERIGQLAGVYAQTGDPGVWREMRQSLADSGFPADMPWEIASDEDRAGSVKFATAIAQQYGSLGDSSSLREFGAMTAGLTPDEVARARKIKLGLAPREVGAARKSVTIKLRNGQEVPGEFDPELGYTVYDPSQNAMVPLGRENISGIRDGADPQPTAPTRNDMEADIKLANELLAAGIPEAQVESFLASRGQRAETMGPPATPSIAGMVGSQTPGDQAYATQQGKTQAEIDNAAQMTKIEAERARQVELAKQQSQNAADKEKVAPKARMQLQQAQMKHENLRRAIGQAVQGSNVWTAGMAGVPLSRLPGTAAANLRASLSTIESNLGFGELQAMRAASPTGGAVGSVTERELDLLASTITSVKQSQSPKQLTDNLRFLNQQYAKVLRQMEADYQQDYGGGAQSRPNQAAPRDDVKRTRISIRD